MVWLRVICLLLGALAVMALTPLTAVASPAVETPCHTSDSGHHSSPDQPEKPMKAMGCCIVCTTSSLAERVVTPLKRAVASTVAPALSADGHSFIFGPEPGPPRL